MARLICPYCDSRNEIEDSDLDWEVSAQNNVHCEECERDFNAIAEHSVIFSCETKEKLK